MYARLGEALFYGLFSICSLVNVLSESELNVIEAAVFERLIKPSHDDRALESYKKTYLQSSVQLKAVQPVIRKLRLSIAPLKAPISSPVCVIFDWGIHQVREFFLVVVQEKRSLDSQ